MIDKFYGTNYEDEHSNNSIFFNLATSWMTSGVNQCGFFFINPQDVFSDMVFCVCKSPVIE